MSWSACSRGWWGRRPGSGLGVVGFVDLASWVWVHLLGGGGGGRCRGASGLYGRCSGLLGSSALWGTGRHLLRLPGRLGPHAALPPRPSGIVGSVVACGCMGRAQGLGGGLGRCTGPWSSAARWCRSLWWCGGFVAWVLGGLGPSGLWSSGSGRCGSAAGLWCRGVRGQGKDLGDLVPSGLGAGIWGRGCAPSVGW